MPTIVLTLLLVVANVFGAAMALPQAIRLVRTRITDGVSPVWAGVSVAMNLWWLAYGLAEGLWGLVPVSAVATVIYLVVAAGVVRLRGLDSLLPVGLGVLLGLGPLPFLVAGGWSAAGVAIGLGYGLQLAPAVVASFRSRRLAGIAPGTWIMAWVESAVWLVYGAVVVDPALLVGGTCGVVLPSVLLARLVVTGHRPFRSLARVTPHAWSIG